MNVFDLSCYIHCTQILEYLPFLAYFSPRSYAYGQVIFWERQKSFLDTKKDWKITGFHIASIFILQDYFATGKELKKHTYL
jgi:hypothetical protein